MGENVKSKEITQKAAIYCRLSEEDRNKTSEDEDSNSIQNQKSMLLQYAKEKGWEVYQIYSDDDYTGSDRKRPQFNKLLEDAGRGRFDIILCKTQSRFTRELELVEKYIHGLFPIWGIRFISIVDNGDTDNKGNKKSRQINGLVNEWYLEDMSENIRSVLNNRRQNGYHIGAFALYGYRKDENRKGHLVIDEEAAEVVREVFHLFAIGYGKTAIARRLNDRGIPNPTEYKRRKGLRYRQPESRNSTLWKYPAIADMLVNEIYIGNMIQGKYGSVSFKTKQNRPRPREEWFRVEGTHEPVIHRELWDMVQERISQRTKPFIEGTTGIFARKARCAQCGYTMRSAKSRGRHYLKCATRYVAEDVCLGAFLAVDALEQAVLEKINSLAAEYLDRELIAERVQNDNYLQQRKERLMTNISCSKKKIEEYERGIKELYLDKVKGILSVDEFAELAKSFTEDKRKLEQSVEEVTNQLVIFEKNLREWNDRKEKQGQLLRLDSLDRESVDMLIDYISVEKRMKGSGIVKVEIHWKF